MDIYKRFEITIVEEELYPAEIDFINLIAELNDLSITISQSGRVILLDNVETIRDAIKIISQIGLADEVGLIREIIEYHPHIEVELLDE